MSGKDMLKRFKQAGWKLESIKGSHHKLVKDGHTYIIPVHGQRDLGPGGTKAALRKLEEVG